MIDNRVVIHEFERDWQPFRFVYYIDNGWVLCEKQSFDSKEWVEGADDLTQEQWSSELESIIVKLLEQFPLKYCSEEKRLKLIEWETR